MHTGIQDFFFDRDFRLVKNGVGTVFIPRFPGKDVVIMQAFAMTHFIFTDQVFPDNRCIGIHRFVWIGNGG